MRKSLTRKSMILMSKINDGEKVNGDEKIKWKINEERNEIWQHPERLFRCYMMREMVRKGSICELK